MSQSNKNLSPQKNLNLNAFKDWVQEISQNLIQSFKENPHQKKLILLTGPMGAGKTQFVHFLLKYLSGEVPSSPTFAIHQSYESIIGLIDHVDLYRLKEEEDLESTGFWDLFEKESGLILIEWADRLDQSAYPVYWEQLQINIRIGEREDLRDIEWG